MRVVSELSEKKETESSITTISNFQVSVDDQHVKISISHKTATDLHHVGLQIWKGALVMADFILNSRVIFGNRFVLELGTGTGFVSVVLGHPQLNVNPSKVYATDMNDPEILSLCQNNLDVNLCNNVTVKSFDLMKANPIHADPPYQWSKEDKITLKTKVDIIVAADIIYDDKLSFAIIQRIFDLLQNDTNPTLYLSLERRLVFTAENGVCSPAYDYFFATLDAFNKQFSEISRIQLDFRQIDLSSFKRFYFLDEYKDSLEGLELWRFRMIHL